MGEYSIRHNYYPLVYLEPLNTMSSPLCFSHRIKPDGEFSFNYELDLTKLFPHAFFAGLDLHKEEMAAITSGQFAMEAGEIEEICVRLADEDFFSWNDYQGHYGNPGPRPKGRELLAVNYEGKSHAVEWLFDPYDTELGVNPLPSYQSPAQTRVEKEIHAFYERVQRCSDLDITLQSTL